MRNVIFPIPSLALFFVAIFTLISCQDNSPSEGDIELIESIENSLLPHIVLEGEENQGYNIHDRMAHFKVPGVSIAFMNGGEIIWARGYGFTSFDSLTPVNERTIFQAASISKPVAAMAAMALVQEGMIGLDEDVNLYLKNWNVEGQNISNEESINLRRILSHSAGLTVHGFRGYAHDEEVPRVIDILNGEEPANSDRIYADILPGSKYRYSGGGYTVMQKLLVDLTGKNFPEIMEHSVLSPLGMKSSTYKQPLPTEYQTGAAVGHRVNGEQVEGRWFAYPEMAAAGLWTTPSDLLRYVMEVQNSLEGNSNLVLSRDLTKEMLTPQLNSHALGPVVQGSDEGRTFSHGGSNEGFKCQLHAFTSTGQGVAIMTNGDNGGTLATEILRSFSKVYGWTTYKPEIRKVMLLDKLSLEPLAGQYAMELQGERLVVELQVNGNHLDGVQLWSDLRFEVLPESETRFFNREDGSTLTFIKDKSGVVSGVVVHERGQEYQLEKI